MATNDSSSSDPAIQLADGRSASAVFYETIADTVAAFPELGSAYVPDGASTFRNRYFDIIPRLEVTRLASRDRAAIAEHMARGLQQRVCFGTEPIEIYLKRSSQPLPLECATGNCAPGWKPEFHYANENWFDLGALAEKLAARNVISPGAREALDWLQSDIQENGAIDLSKRKVVVFGANAEMASTRHFLKAGADVLWLDVTPPSEKLIQSNSQAGDLSWVEPGIDLLTQPAEVLSTIRMFAGSERVDLCLYAYSPGQAKEIKLTAAMNAIVDNLPPEQIRSVTLLLSPTTATPLDSTDLDLLKARRESRPTWEAVSETVGLIGSGGGTEIAGDLGASRTVVSIQGASYQAAQYIGKLMTAEKWASKGLRVSANTAAITKTRSMDHPVFDGAFDGAGAFQVETFSPGQSQCLSGLLAVHDWLNPVPPVPGRIRVHGGIHTLPYPLNVALRMAAAIGFAKSPGLLLGLLWGGRRA